MNLPDLKPDLTLADSNGVIGRALPISPLPPELVPVAVPLAPPASAPASTLERIRQVLDLVQVTAEQMILLAEALSTLKGAERKRFVVDETLRQVRRLEAEYNLIPGMVEGAAFYLARLILSYTVERTFRALEARGMVNAR